MFTMRATSSVRYFRLWLVAREGVVELFAHPWSGYWSGSAAFVVGDGDDQAQTQREKDMCSELSSTGRYQIYCPGRDRETAASSLAPRPRRVSAEITRSIIKRHLVDC